MSKHEIMSKEERLEIQAKLGAGEKVTIQGDKVMLEYDDYDAMIDAFVNDFDSNIVISSRGVAEMFDMTHGNLIVVIKDSFTSRNLICRDSRNVAGVVLERRPDFWETNYTASNNKSNKQYLMTSDGFMMLMSLLPKAKDKRVRNMRIDLQIRIVKRMRLLQETLYVAFNTTIKDQREFGKVVRRNLTDTIKHKLLEFGGDEKDVGKVYAYVTSVIYDYIDLKKEFRKGKRDEMNDEVLIVIVNCETIISAYVAQLRVKKFNVKTIRRERGNLFHAINVHMDQLKCQDIVEKYMNQD